MAGTATAEKGWATKRRTAAAEWLRATQGLLREEDTIAESSRKDCMRELRRCLMDCGDHLTLQEKVLGKFTRAYDELKEHSEEDDKKFSEYISCTHDTIWQLSERTSALKRALMDLSEESESQQTSTGMSVRNSSQPLSSLSVRRDIDANATETELWDRYWSPESTGTEEYTGPQKTEHQQINEKVIEDFKKTVRHREDGAQGSKEAYEKYREAKRIFGDLNMSLREYISNDEGLNNALSEEDRTKNLCPKNDMIVDYPFEYVQISDDDETYHPEEMLHMRTRLNAQAALRSSHDLIEKFWTL
ncbi:hypothetical protein GCK32_016166 [Trichostrongylus colubriformis]|uniref:Uncharacterized protein n=1 Tax=Trichostrongylus colubriformis TaxID=6319 RepID=A0AAN8FV39_TRICO